MNIRAQVKKVSWIIEPGFFSNSSVTTALVIGGVVAISSAVTGLFTVLGRQAFAGEALGDVGAVGGSGAYLVNINPLWGFLTVAIGSAGIIGALGSRRSSDRDVSTGIVLSGALGVAALFLYLDATHAHVSGTSMTVLFGSLFVISNTLVWVVIGFSAAVLVLMMLFFQMLLLVSLNIELAQVRGIPVRLLSVGYLVAVGVCVALSALSVGAVLSTALLIGPPASALRISKSPRGAAFLSACIGVFSVWLGILLSYDSASWPPLGHGWPVSSLIVAIIFVVYLATGLGQRRRNIRYNSARIGVLSESVR
jgi:zinc/manganese transport system permease protein